MRPAPRSWLFVPADSPPKIERALGSAADALIFDLEDSVALVAKVGARATLHAYLATHGGGVPQRWVRINPLGSEDFAADLAACADFAIDGIVLPKSESGGDVSALAAAIAPRPWRIHAIVTETAASLFGLMSYRGASPTLAAMSWGAEDLSAALGASAKTDADGALSFTYQLARSLCLAGAIAAGVQPVDGVFADFRDSAGLEREAAAARRDGFTGKLAIHPDQIAPINAAFTPSVEEVDHARSIVEAFEADPSAGVLAVGGRMVDRPHLTQARAVLERALVRGGR